MVDPTPAEDAIEEVKQETDVSARKGEGPTHVVITVPADETYIGDAGKIMFDYGFYPTAQHESYHYGEEKQHIQFHKRSP